MYRALFCCCLLLPHLATAIDTDARVLVFPSLKNPGTHPSTLQSLYRSIVLDLNSFRHFKIASISSTEIEGLDFPPQGAQAQHIWNTATRFESDLLLRLACTRFATKYIVILELYQAASPNPIATARTVKRVVDKSALVSSTFLKEIMEEVFYPRSIYNERGFFHLSDQIRYPVLVEGQPLPRPGRHFSSLFAAQPGAVLFRLNTPGGPLEYHVQLRPGEIVEITPPPPAPPPPLIEPLPRRSPTLVSADSAWWSNPYLYVVGSALLLSLSAGAAWWLLVPEETQYKVSFRSSGNQ